LPGALLSPTVFTLAPLRALFLFGTWGLAQASCGAGLLVPGQCSSTNAIMAAEPAGLKCIPVNPATVVFAKSTYPASGKEVTQFSMDSKNAAKSGIWYIRLRVKELVSGAWEVKSPLRRITAVGFYATKDEAMSEVLDRRMSNEGFERRGGYWHASILKSNTGGVGGRGR
jgi:hypothetical protein